MNRPFKFRGWDTIKKKWINLRDEVVILFNGNIFIPYDEDIIIQQFTGLQDKNGIDIYEGDIVKVKEVIYAEKKIGEDPTKIIGEKETIGLVVWSHPSFRFYVDFSHVRYDESEDLICNEYRYRIIGNIFENEDLLTKK